jgi:hypothetical protein
VGEDRLESRRRNGTEEEIGLLISEKEAIGGLTALDNAA